MSFQPILPFTGYPGWRFLQQTLPSQTDAFIGSSVVSRATEYFREEISAVETAEQLVADRRLLEVALGAFGLEDDLNSKAFIRKVLEEGTLNEDAFANRLADSRYRELAREFGFGDLGSQTGRNGFADRILARYEARQFEVAVGRQNDDFRLALNLETSLADMVAQDVPESTQWYTVMGNPPLRKVFETALGFASSFAGIDIDQQKTAFEDRARSVFGTDRVTDFEDPDLQEKLVRLFLIRSEAASFSANSSGSVALTLLRSIPRLAG